MRKLCISIVFVLLGLPGIAGNESLFTFDEDQFNKEFSSLNKLEQYLIENNSSSMNDLDFTNFLAKEGINLSLMHTNAIDDLDFQWEGFLWGFLCCPVGFFVIAINEEKTKDDKVSYWIGVAVASIIYAASGPGVYHYVFP